MSEDKQADYLSPPTVSILKGSPLQIVRPSPLKCPSLWIVPPQNHFVPHHINNRYINSYTVHFSLGRGGGELREKVQ